MVRLYKELYKELYKNDIEMRVKTDYDVPDRMRVIFEKGACCYVVSFDLDNIPPIEFLLHKLEIFLNEYEIEHKLVRPL